MKSLFLTVLIFSSLLTFSQDKNNKVLKINPINEDVLHIEKNSHRYDNFQDGKLVLNDSTVYELKMNYHQIYDEVLFISSKGDTLAVKEPETIAYVVIGTDSFYYVNKGFVQKVTHFEANNILAKRILKYIGKESKGPYGVYSPVSSSYNQPEIAVTDLDHLRKMKNDELLLYVYHVQYYISDRFRNYYPVTKKNIFNIFSKNEKELKQYFKANDVNLNKYDDLNKLLTFIYGLN